jgi:hypothetical protein
MSLSAIADRLTTAIPVTTTMNSPNQTRAEPWPAGMQYKDLRDTALFNRVHVRVSLATSTHGVTVLALWVCSATTHVRNWL